MILDDKLFFRSTGGSKDLVTSGTTAVTSDYIDTVASGVYNTQKRVIAHINVKASNAAAGANFTFALVNSDTSGGTYTTISSKVVPLAEVNALANIALDVPKDAKQFLKVIITPAASMTGGITANAVISIEA